MEAPGTVEGGGGTVAIGGYGSLIVRHIPIPPWTAMGRVL